MILARKKNLILVSSDQILFIVVWESISCLARFSTEQCWSSVRVTMRFLVASPIQVLPKVKVSFTVKNHLFRSYTGIWNGSAPTAPSLTLKQQKSISEQSTSIPQFGWEASSRKRPSGSKFLSFVDDRGYCAHLDFRCCSFFFYTVPQIKASIQSCLWGLQAIPWTSWLGWCSNIHCQW